MVASMPTAASAMTPVATHPTITRPRVRVKRPMIFGRVASSIIIAITGTATTPLMTALQNSALIGSIGVKLRAAPMTVAMAMVA